MPALQAAYIEAEYMETGRDGAGRGRGPPL